MYQETPGFLKFLGSKNCVKKIQIKLLLVVILNPFVPKGPFLKPLKTSENHKVFQYFQGAEKVGIGNELVNPFEVKRG